MHEYRLETNENGTPQEEGWVVCRVFKKRMATVRKLDDPPCWYDDQVSFMADMDSPGARMPHHPNYHTPNSNFHHHHHQHNMYPCKQELEIVPYNMSHQHDPFLQLPQLESPRMPHASMQSCGTIPPYGTSSNMPSSVLTQDQVFHSQHMDSMFGNTCGSDQFFDQVTDWRVLDKFVASQLSHDEQHGPSVPNKESNYSNSPIFPVSEDMNMVISPNNSNNKQDHLGVPSDHHQYASTSTSSCQIDMWK
uniref:NAC5 n=1 Tax=Haloxylon ammodendron TaxID=151230 RepID=A0A1B1SHT5_9CARY|nr:NAC5 [Haloxylon ammodendron]